MCESTATFAEWITLGAIVCAAVVTIYMTFRYQRRAAVIIRCMEISQRRLDELIEESERMKP